MMEPLARGGPLSALLVAGLWYGLVYLALLAYAIGGAIRRRPSVRSATPGEGPDVGPTI